MIPSPAKQLWAISCLILLLVLAACRAGVPTPPGASPTPATMASASATRIMATARQTDSTGPTTAASATSSRPTATATAGQISAEPVPVTPTAAALATPTRSPASSSTLTPIGSAPVAILSFTASAEEAVPGDTISLSWATRGAAVIVLYHMMPGGQFGTHWAVEPEGSFVYEVPPEERNRVDFILAATDAAGHLAQQRVSITLRCLDDWFFTSAPDICPAGAPLVSAAAEQHFENGVMIWVEVEARIYVLFDSGSPAWSASADTWQVGEPESDPELAPPPGLDQPVRGFGKVWRQEAGVRERLGWALAPETGFTTILQRTSYSKYNQTYLRALDGGVWKLLAEHSGWEKLLQ